MLFCIWHERRLCVAPRLREDFSVCSTRSLEGWGWNKYFEAFWCGGDWKNAVPARVVAQQRKFWRVAGDFSECWAEASGKLRLAADEGAHWPAVGDWVVVELHGADTTAAIQEVLPRRSKFVRKLPGKKMEEQVIAANLDTALLVSALDDDFNPRRVERYLAQCWESGAKPVIVLNKADACEEARGKAAGMEGGALLMDTPGLREMQLWDAEHGVAQAFADIDSLAAQCRFGDCRHEAEPGCAVLAALSAGTLDPVRVENRRKLLREQEFLRRKMDPEARQVQKEQWKEIHRAARQKYQQREKDGGKR